MSPEQVAAIRAALAGARIADDDKTLIYEFRRGWNEGVEFAQNQINRILKDAKP